MYIESTGVYHRLTIKIFGNQLVSVLINPKIIKDLLKTEVKDDHKDALTLAKLALSFDLRASRIDSYEHYQIKKAMRYERKLIQNRTQVSNRIGSFLTDNYVPLANAIKMMSKTGKDIITGIIAGETNRSILLQSVYGVPRSMFLH